MWFILSALVFAAPLQNDTYDTQTGTWIKSSKPPVVFEGSYAVSRYGKLQIGPGKQDYKVYLGRRTIMKDELVLYRFEEAEAAGPSDLFIVSGLTLDDKCKTRLYVIEIAPGGRAKASKPFGDCSPDIPQAITLSPARAVGGAWSMEFETDGVRYRYANGVGVRIGAGRPLAPGEKEQSIGTLVKPGR